MSRNSMIPKFRFQGFSEPWKECKVEDIFKITRGCVLATAQTNSTQNVNKPYPVYSSQTKDNGLMGYYSSYLYEDAITWTTDGANAGTVRYRSEKFYCTNVCGVLLEDSVKPNQMIAEALNNIAKQYVSYVGNPKLMNNIMAEIRIMIPTQEEERCKMSRLFFGIDSLIAFHQRKCEKLSNIKKALLDKMFPQGDCDTPRLRFQGFSEPWEECKFEDIACLKRGLTYSPINVNANGIRVLRSSNIDGDVFNIHNDDVFVKKECVNIPYVSNGDILITSANGSSKLVGKHAIIYNIESYSAVHGGFMLVATTKNYNFLNASMSSSWYKKFIDLFVSGGNGAIGNLSKSTLCTYKFLIPSNEEQERIGEFFSSLDSLIALHQRKCEKLSNIKKALLDKMFI